MDTEVWQERVRRRLGIDARALGLFRIFMGLFIMFDVVLLRLPDLVMFYTDAGVLPRQVLLSEFSHATGFSIYNMVGSPEGVAALFLLQFLVGIGLCIGWHTRVMTAAAWIMVMSLHNRMPVVLNGGDDLMRMLLFWAIFVPLGARYSVDAVRKGKQAGRILTVGTAAILFQVVAMYATNAAIKHGGDLWSGGMAIRYALSIEQFTTIFGDIISQFPIFMMVMTLTVYVAWLTSPLLLINAGRLRALQVALFMSIHVGIGLSMYLGLFSFVAISGLMLFMPSRILDRVIPEEQIESFSEQYVYPWLSDGSYIIVPSDVRKVIYGFAILVICYMMIFTVVWNLQEVTSQRDDMDTVDHVPQHMEDISGTFRFVQYWSMFAPDPLRDDGWYVIPGRLSNGSRIDLYGGGEVSYSKPADVSAQYPNQRWRKYMMNLWLRSHSEYRQYYGDYLCRSWNSSYEVRLEQYRIVYVLEKTTDGEDAPTERTTIFNGYCGS